MEGHHHTCHVAEDAVSCAKLAFSQRTDPALTVSWDFSQRRQGGSWHKAQLEGAARPGNGRGPGGAGNAAQTSFPDSQAVPKRPSPEKMNQKLFTGPSSNAFSLEASSAL